MQTHEPLESTSLVLQTIGAKLEGKHPSPTLVYPLKQIHSVLN